MKLGLNSEEWKLWEELMAKSNRVQKETMLIDLQQRLNDIYRQRMEEIKNEK